MKSPEYSEPRYALRDDGAIKKCASAEAVEEFALGHSVTLTTKDPECDFCSRVGEPEYRQYPCRKFSVLVGHQQHNSVGAWLACRGCADLVDVGDREALADRAVERVRVQVRALQLPPRVEREYVAQSRSILRVLHDAFFHYRSDDAQGKGDA